MSDVEFDDFAYESGDDDHYEEFGTDDDDQDMDMDLDDGLLPDISKHEQKDSEVEFAVHTLDEIRAFQTREADHVAGIIDIAPEHAATLLRHFTWNKELLIERYMDDPVRVLKEAGVRLANADGSSASGPVVTTVNNFTCEVCYGEGDDVLSVALRCGHRFCAACYAHYLTQKIRDEGESRRITCMGAKCKLIVDAATVAALVDAATLSRYETLLLRTFVDDSKYLRWCPAPNCDRAIECHVARTQLDKVVPSVTCSCGHRFCFGCALDDHQPCVCSLVKIWMKKCQDDSETANWISANTKECPKCQSTIEKNGGCNHMTCKKCRYEWCWVCLGPWAEHGSSWYNCGRFDETASVNARDAQAKARASLERYLHYYNRYANHEQSAKLDKKVYQATEAKMQEMQLQSDLSWIEVQFLKRAVDIVMSCRMTLKWTYAFAFYLDRTNMTELFESNQRDLELAVEHLSGLLESEIVPASIPQLRQKVLDKTVYVQQRRDILVEDTARGLKEGRWTWTVRP
ncbi:hypothetical protein AMAG_02785 [Allomyces macrogynus ATCC 38327]|uniref:RBR-type E3 ubiquitin transferase n=1 Tax=Allomyces macrogynus (strain ATCC 38327) TaxID=578462 RepID=A0A0L0S3Q5_ALLM3|nr:hypothetical protein AMAG_02785 [Allomyces macrogynus ATCC 38327]|eukprot:KNE57025.1 hypothetical protein AMAG_02785 [Allomyces macrogynus ATCC 38327]